MQVHPIPSSKVSRRWSILASALLIALLLNGLTSNAQETFPPRHASGTVVDFAGKPVEGATVYNYFETVTTDADGKFSLEYQQSTPHQGFHTWAFAEGHGVRTVRMASKFRDNPSIENVKIRLPRTESYQFRIVKPDGEPFASQTVRISSVSIPNGVFAADESTGLLTGVPEPVAEFTQSKTDEEGVVVFERFPKSLVVSLSIETPKWGNQVFGIGSRRTKELNKWKLAEVGSIEGVFHAKDPKQYAGCQVFLESDSNVLSRTVVEVDSEGKFTVPAFVSGGVSIRVRWPKDVDIYLLKESTVQVKPGEVTKVESELEPARLLQVKGVVLTEDTRKPIVGASLSLKDVRGRYGSPRVQTNESGEYSAELCEGPIRVQVHTQGSERSGHYDYPPAISMKLSREGNKPVQLPELLLSPQQVIKGMLVDFEGEAIPDATVVIAKGAFGHTLGSATTNELGEFEMPVWKGWSPDPGSQRGSFFALQLPVTQYGKLPRLEKLELLFNEDNDVFKLQRSK